MAESLPLPPSHECVGDSALREKSGHTSMSASAVGQPQPSASASVLPSSSFSTPTIPICQFLGRTKSPQKNSHRRAVASSDVPRGTQSPRAPLTPDPAGIRWLNVPRGTPTRPKGSNSWPADGFDTLHRSMFHVEHSLFLIFTPGKSAFCVAFRDRFSTFLPFSSPSCSKFTSAPSPARYRVYPAEPPPLPAAFHNCVPVLHRRNPLRRPVRSP